MTLRRFNDLGIRQKLFATYFLFVVLSLCLFLAVNTALAVRENERQTLRAAEHVFGQTRDYLQFKTESLRNLLYLLAANPSLQEIFERRASWYTQQIGRWPIDSQALEKLLYPTSVNPDIAGIRFYMRYGLASVYENDRFVSFSTVEAQPWFRKLDSDNRRTWWFVDAPTGGDGDEGSVHVARSVFGSQDINELIGVIQFDIPLRVLRSTLANALLTESTVVLLVNADGWVVCTAGSLGRVTAGELWRAATARGAALQGTAAWSTLGVDGVGSYLVGRQAIDNSDWTLLLAVPYRDIVRLAARPLGQMVTAFLLIVPLSLLFALVVSRSATRRIQDLMGQVRKVVEGDFSVTVEPRNRDEIGQLTESFNVMVARLEELVEERYRLGQEVKQLELKALQAQINPHFLYNTLDLINWKSLKYEAEEIRVLVGTLSRFYKLSLGRGEDEVTLSDEVAHARAYVEIQNMRFDDAITLVVDVPEELAGFTILKLVVQPLVENAILHGIMPSPGGRGTVRIAAALGDDALTVTVEDDGVGMSEDTLRDIRTGTLAAADHHGYGVRNVHERLRLRYGAGFGLSFESAPVRGTRATVKVPGSRDAARREKSHEHAQA